MRAIGRRELLYFAIALTVPALFYSTLPWNPALATREYLDAFFGADTVRVVANLAIRRGRPLPGQGASLFFASGRHPCANRQALGDGGRRVPCVSHRFRHGRRVSVLAVALSMHFRPHGVCRGRSAAVDHDGEGLQHSARDLSARLRDVDARAEPRAHGRQPCDHIHRDVIGNNHECRAGRVVHAATGKTLEWKKTIFFIAVAILLLSSVQKSCIQRPYISSTSLR